LVFLRNKTDSFIYFLISTYAEKHEQALPNGSLQLIPEQAPVC
jgi:hypothetical protein